MKALILLSIAVHLANVPAVAQHPLVGTWEMISVKGINAEGEPFYLDTTSTRETKIITPTHYMLIAWDTDGDSLMFNRTMAGRVRLEGEKYIEEPTQASVQLFDEIKVDFTWKLEGDIFTQAGTIVRPDGKLVVLDALIFRRSKRGVGHVENKAIGAWNKVSENTIAEDGGSHASFNASDKQFLLVTPTHWMRMDHKNKKFDGVMYGTYTLAGDTITSTVDYSSLPITGGDTSKLSQKVDGDKLEIISPGFAPSGDSVTFHHVYERD